MLRTDAEFDAQSWPVIRRFDELRTSMDRILIVWALGLDVTAKCVIDEFLEDDPHTIMYLYWLEDSLRQSKTASAGIRVMIKFITNDFIRACHERLNK